MAEVILILESLSKLIVFFSLLLSFALLHHHLPFCPIHWMSEQTLRQTHRHSLLSRIIVRPKITRSKFPLDLRTSDDPRDGRQFLGILSDTLVGWSKEAIVVGTPEVPVESTYTRMIRIRHE